jgi:hypothetical protein
VQLFDTREARADASAAFLADGYHAGDVLAVIVSRDGWDELEPRLAARGCRTIEARASGRLLAFDSSEVLPRLAPDGWPEKAVFHAFTAELIERAGTAPIRVYGDMVDRLAEEGSYRGAERLEQLWCELSRRVPFSVLCGYMAAHFGDPRRLADLTRICGLHDEVRTHEDDMLGTWLTARATALL